LLTLFNVLPDLTCVLPTNCECTAVRHTNIRRTNFEVMSLSSFSPSP